MLTRRGVATLTSVVAFFVLTNITYDPIFSVASSVLLFLLALEAVKFRLAARSLRRLAISRELGEERIIVGDTLDVAVRIEGAGGRVAAMLETADTLPRGLQVLNGSSTQLEEVKGGMSLGFDYSAKATEVGPMALEKFVVTLFDRYGLFMVRRDVPCASVIEVYPRIPSGYVAMPRRERAAIALVEKGSSRKGPGTETSGIRGYMPGDEYRMIAWKAMARSPNLTPMTKEVDEVRSLDLVIAFSANRSMKDGDPGLRKVDLAVQASLATARQAIKDGHSVSFLVPARPGFRLVSGSLTYLAQSVVEIEHRDADLLEYVEFIKNRVAKRQVVVFVTDLPYPRTLDLTPLLFLRSEGHEVYLIILDTPSFFTAVGDSEGQRLTIDILDTIERRHVDEVLAECARLGLRAYRCGAGEVTERMLGILSEGRGSYPS